MALIAHQGQGCHTVLPSRPELWKKGVKVRTSVSFHLGWRPCKLPSLKYVQQSSHPIVSRQVTRFRVSSFKGNSHNELQDTDARFRSSKNSVQLSLSQEERKEVSTESPDLISSQDNEDTISGSPAIKNLFWRWLIMLRSQTTTSLLIGEPQNEYSEKSASVSFPAVTHGEQRQNLLKFAVLRLWALDATIKLPLLIFPPFYLVVRLAYGMEVAKELTPLWVAGPLIVAFYITLIRGVISLYVLSFKLSKKFIINLPSYYNFVSEGKLKAYLLDRLWRPVDDLKNMDYRKVSIAKLKQLLEWATEKRLDLVESIWPYYCAMIRFLKKANLI